MELLGWVLIQYCMLSSQSYSTLWDPMDCSPPGSSVHGLSQARILGWVAISFSRGSSQPRDWTCISCITCTGRQILYHWALWKAQSNISGVLLRKVRDIHDMLTWTAMRWNSRRVATGKPRREVSEKAKPAYTFLLKGSLFPLGLLSW